MRYSPWKLDLVSNILWMIVDKKCNEKLTNTQSGKLLSFREFTNEKKIWKQNYTLFYKQFFSATIDHKNNFTQDILHSYFISEKAFAFSIADAFRNIHFFIFLLVFTEDEVCHISNRYQPPNNLAEYQYFYTRDFISLLHFEKILALSIANVFRDIHFLQNFHCLKKERFYIFNDISLKSMSQWNFSDLLESLSKEGLIVSCVTIFFS